MRFLLVDKIISIEAGQSITAVKNLSLAEEYLGDHFPGFPVMPGVLMVEALVQAGSWLMRYTEDFAYSMILLRDLKAVRFNNFVSPGRTLTVTAQVHKWEGGFCELKGTGTVDGKSTVSTRLTLERFNLADRNPELAESDRRRNEKMREVFDLLWKPPAALANR